MKCDHIMGGGEPMINADWEQPGTEIYASFIQNQDTGTQFE